ncbi:hypothetical protein SADUNF_Sadunf19G0097500 [Salix dunnii]|uniref:O-methyltransferase C-terminal domain-containing protein n=1 Tax=Salix dunnii TaxID=1413687 RepID=A0A835MCZ9_9ROSI|nr:hypothetical protein SADUNF_Sadunf19G0097500 [Salix dunnii]
MLEKSMELIDEEGANELLQAQTRVWNHALAFINSMALKCAVQLDIPDAIQNHGKPMTLSELLAMITNKTARLDNLFNEAMASDSALASGVVMKKCKGVFEGLKSLVDVGGGTGVMAKCIAETFPTTNCTVFYLPHVVSGLQGSNNLKFVGGDMFESVPSADAILLKWILHDWSDEECVKILQQCKEALGRNGKIGGKVIIIDMILGNQNWDEKSAETQLFFDLFIMACVSGRERSEKELANLFFAAGFSNYKINPVLGVRGLIEVYP